LNLVRTKVADLSPLVSLTNLQWLDISETSVVDVFPLAELERLQVLSVVGIEITQGLGVLSSLSLRGCWIHR
jgi:internalin A